MKGYRIAFGLWLIGWVGGLVAAAGEEVILVAGGGTGGDGSAAREAKLVQPFGVDFLGSTVYFVEMLGGDRLRAITGEGKVITLAGVAGQKGNAGDGGDPLAARFNGLHALAVGPDGRIYLADTFNHRVRVYDPQRRTLTGFAGTGEAGYSGDGGPAAQATFRGIHHLAFDPSGKNLYLTDLGNRRIRRVDLKTGVVTTVAGNGDKGVLQEGGRATEQPLVDPRAAVVDAQGRIWILERSGHALRVVDADGTIRTVAGTGKAGQGLGPARDAALNGPKHLCLDRDGSILIADTENHRIVRYDPKQQTLTQVAGTGKRGSRIVTNDPLQTELAQPHGVHVHPGTGDIYIADSSNHRILRIVRR